VSKTYKTGQQAPISGGASPRRNRSGTDRGPRAAPPADSQARPAVFRGVLLRCCPGASPNIGRE
jgi:hypothetical protein